MREWWQRWEHRWGILLGVAALVADFTLGNQLSPRSLAVPLPLFLALSQLARGLIQGLRYWNYQPALFHLGYLSIIVLSGFMLLTWQKWRGAFGLDLIRTALIATALPVAVRSLLRVDHFIVGFYYALSAAMSFGWTLILSRRLNRILGKIGYDGVNY